MHTKKFAWSKFVNGILYWRVKSIKFKHETSKLKKKEIENIFWPVTFKVKMWYSLLQEINLEMPFWASFLLSPQSPLLKASIWLNQLPMLPIAEQEFNGRNFSISEISQYLLYNPYNLKKYLTSISITITWNT